MDPSSGTTCLPDVPPADDGYPLSFAQERLWFLDQLMPGSAFYNLPLAVRFTVPLISSVLERSLQECVRRHEVLRTSFQIVGGEPSQVIASNLSVSLPVSDLRQLSPARREDEAVRLATEEAVRPFDLGKAPLFRAALLRLGARDHVLLLTLHHIIADDWSLGVFWRELAAVYTAFASGRPSPLPPLRIQYLDFSIWQREWLQGEVLDKQLGYWKRQLHGLTTLEVRTDRPRRAISTFRGAFETVSVPKPVTEALKELSRREGATLFMVLLTAFQALLARYSGQTDIAVGVPIANRNRAELESLIGFFVNTLVMRVDLSGDPTFQEALGRVREMALAAYAHQDLPFEKLVEELHPQRDLSRNPLVQVTFQLQQATESGKAARTLGAAPLSVNRGTSIFDLAFRLWEHSDSLSGGIEYSTDLFDASTIQRFARQFVMLLEGIASDPARRLSSIPLMSETEKRRLLNDFNPGRSLRRLEPSLPDSFDQQAKRTPSAVALSLGNEQLTYLDLAGRANQLARWLLRQGVGPEVLVAVRMERSLDMVIAMLAVWKAGGAYVPIDPSYPHERIAFMLRDAGVALAIVNKAADPRWFAEGPKVIFMDDLPAGLDRLEKSAPGVFIRPSQPAYVIYTSGSTGTPKGVVIPHGALANHMHWMQTHFPLVPRDRVLQKTSISFDASVWEFWAPLRAGAKLVMAPPEQHIDGRFIVDQILRHAVTVVQLVPSLFKLCLEDARFAKCRSLRRVFCGGEPLAADLVERFWASGLKASLHNLYGPSEATIDATCWTCSRAHWKPEVFIGLPIDGMEAFVLDPFGQPVPPGAVGELYLSGAGLARGYINAPELTAERFVPHPFNSEQGARLYRTGDLARHRPSGELEYVGRVDTQVKVRGMRVELAEIECAIRQHPAISDAVAVVREDEPGDQRLTAYFVSKGQLNGIIHELRLLLNEHLPQHMVPSMWVPLPRLPQTPSGKVDRRALPKPEEPSDPSRAAEGPRSPVEEKLVAIWAEVLKRRKVGIQENFFELGGHSLLATQLIARVREEFAIDVPLRHVFQSPTPAQLALAIENLILEEVEQVGEGGREGLPAEAKSVHGG